MCKNNSSAEGKLLFGNLGGIYDVKNIIENFIKFFLLKMVIKLEWIRLVLGLNGIDRWAMVAIITYPSLAAPNVNERVKAQQKLK